MDERRKFIERIKADFDAVVRPRLEAQWREDARRESERTHRMICAVPADSMRVGPGTDAVVWNICDSSHEVVEL